MTITSLPSVLDLAQWDALTGAEDTRHELVRGVPVVSPSEAHINTVAAATICRLLDEAFGPRWKAVPQVQVDLTRPGRPPTVRVPDVALLPADVDRHACRHAAALVPLVVEFVSPSSAHTDWVVKHAEYAAAGIGRYLVVDATDEPRMALFDRIVDGAYSDPRVEGDRCRLDVDGVVLPLRLADVLAW